MKLTTVLLLILTLIMYSYIFRNKMTKENVKPPIPTISPTQKNIPTKITINLNSDKLWSVINDHRQMYGLKPFIKDQSLCAIAKDRVEEQEGLGYLDNHKGFIERYSNRTYGLSENVHSGAIDEEGTYLGWYYSEGHRKAMMGTWTHSCVATKGHYAVQIFSSFDGYDHNAL